MLAGNGGGAVINVLSVLAWFSMPSTAIYCASKAAGWSLTNSLRQELAAQHTQVLGLYVGFMDTDMASFVPAEQKINPAVVAKLAITGLLDGQPEILADDLSRQVKAGLATANS